MFNCSCGKQFEIIINEKNPERVHIYEPMPFLQKEEHNSTPRPKSTQSTLNITPALSRMGVIDWANDDYDCLGLERIPLQTKASYDEQSKILTRQHHISMIWNLIRDEPEYKHLTVAKLANFVGYSEQNLYNWSVKFANMKS